MFIERPVRRRLPWAAISSWIRRQNPTRRCRPRSSRNPQLAAKVRPGLRSTAQDRASASPALKLPAGISSAIERPERGSSAGSFPILSKNCAVTELVKLMSDFQAPGSGRSGGSVSDGDGLGDCSEQCVEVGSATQENCNRYEVLHLPPLSHDSRLLAERLDEQPFAGTHGRIIAVPSSLGQLKPVGGQ